VIFLALLLALLIRDIAWKDPNNLASLGGMFVLLLIMFVTSKHPGKVSKWSYKNISHFSWLIRPDLIPVSAGVSVA
jgi:hypothetical protein